MHSSSLDGHALHPGMRLLNIHVIKMADAAPVVYTDFFVFPDVVKTKEDCSAKCKLCFKPYKYTLTTKGNLLKHLQTKHKPALDKHKEEQLRLNESHQITLSPCGSLVKKQTDFKKQEIILTSVVKNLCGAGGLAIGIVEQPWFRHFMKDVEPRFRPVSRNGIKRKLSDLYQQEYSALLNEVKVIALKPTVTLDFWTGRDGRSFMGCTIHYVHEKELKNSMLFFREVPPPHTSENIRIKFEDELDHCGVGCFKVVTDNAAKCLPIS